MPVTTVPNATPRAVCPCGSKKISMCRTLSAFTLAIGGGQVGEILFGMEDAHSLIIDVEKILEVREGIGGAHLLHRSEGDGDMVTLRELEHQFGFERTFDMKVQFGLGQARDEGGALFARGETVRHRETPLAEG